jgi:hypothetical protein
MCRWLAGLAAGQPCIGQIEKRRRLGGAKTQCRLRFGTREIRRDAPRRHLPNQDRRDADQDHGP